MATAKLWWNGSSWKTSSTKWKSEEKMGNHSMGVRHNITIAAYDDNTIKMGQSFEAYTTNHTYFSIGMTSKAVTVKSGSTTIGSGDFSGKVVTNYTKFSYSGVARSQGVANYQAYGSGDISFSGSTTISSPFRKITYNVNQGTGSPGTQTVLSGIASKVKPAATPTRTNYIFTGWATSSTATKATYSNGSSITITSDTTLYAVWKQTAFKVKINADEGSTIVLDDLEISGESTEEYVDFGSYTVAMYANTGYVLKTRSHQDGTISITDNTTVLSATSQRVGCHLDDGENWVQAMMYYDDGEQWVMVQAYYDDGEQWNLVF